MDDVISWDFIAVGGVLVVVVVVEDEDDELTFASSG